MMTSIELIAVGMEMKVGAEVRDTVKEAFTDLGTACEG